MKMQDRCVAVLIVAAIATCFSACNRGQDSSSVQAAGAATARPATQKPEVPTAQASAAPARPGSTSTPASPDPIPGATSNSGALPKVVVSDHSQTFTVAQHAFRLLNHVQRIETTPGKAVDETVEWWELRNDKDQVVYRQTYPVSFMDGGFESTVGISASSFTTQQGAGILVQGMDLPSAPDSGGWVQVFAFKYGRDKYGADDSLFGPFGPPIFVEGEFLEVGTDTLRPTPMIKGAATITTMRDVLRFKVRTGNFHIVYPVLINWITGKLQPGWRCIESTTKGQIERCSYPVEVEAHRDNQATFVRLFPEADDGFTPKHIIVQPESKIEFLEARAPVRWSEDDKAITFDVNGDVWLKIRINGQEGWIHSQEDFDAVGLPQSG